MQGVVVLTMQPQLQSSQTQTSPASQSESVVHSPVATVHDSDVLQLAETTKASSTKAERRSSRAMMGILSQRGPARQWASTDAVGWRTAFPEQAAQHPSAAAATPPSRPRPPRRYVHPDGHPGDAHPKPAT